MDKRVDYLDGLKGFIAIWVVFTHFMLALFPKGYVGFGSGAAGNMKAEVVANLPWSLLSNSSLSLYLFFAMIPMFIVLGYRRHGNDVAVLQRQAAGRYFQFVIPVFAATVLAFVLYECGFLKYDAMAELTGAPWSQAIIPTTHHVGWMLFYGLLGIYFNNQVEFLTVLWCMHIIFIGSMLTYGIWALFGNSRYRCLAGIVYVIVGCFMPEYLVFAGGGLMGEILYSSQKQEKAGKHTNRTWIGLLCILLGAMLGLVPSPLLPEHVTLHMTYALASMLLLYGWIQCSWAQKLSSWKGIVGVGQYSFSVILSHILVLYSFSYWLYRLLKHFITDAGVLFGLTFLASLGVILVCSKVFFVLFERPSRLLAKRVSGYLCDMGENKDKTGAVR
ncbi:MAG: acyltransferase [Lachnospiraceae bacterium]|nr:acyltransferase [Lachnospiraceae bacterium]